jgi:hypothetical protein
MALYLVSECCRPTHEIFSAGGHRFARGAVGVTRGQVTGDAPTLEDVHEYLAEICGESDLVLPASDQAVALDPLTPPLRARPPALIVTPSSPASGRGGAHRTRGRKTPRRADPRQNGITIAAPIRDGRVGPRASD